MPVESRVRGAFVDSGWPPPRKPTTLSARLGTWLDHVGPRLAAIASNLQIAVVGARPNQLPVARRLADGVNGGVHLGFRVIHRDAARFLLLLLFRIVRRQIRRNAVPGLAVIARAEQELRADIDGPLFIRAQMQSGVFQLKCSLLFAIIGLRLNASRSERVPVHARNGSALRFHVDVIRVRRIGKSEESIAAV